MSTINALVNDQSGNTPSIDDCLQVVRELPDDLSTLTAAQRKVVGFAVALLSMWPPAEWTKDLAAATHARLHAAWRE